MITVLVILSIVSFIFSLVYAYEAYEAVDRAAALLERAEARLAQIENQVFTREVDLS